MQGVKATARVMRGHKMAAQKIAKGDRVVMYYPAANVMLGPEIQWGKRENFKDGFTSETVRPEEFRTLVADLDVELESVEVDESSRFYLVRKVGRTKTM